MTRTPPSFPLTYREARERFRWRSRNARATLTAHPLDGLRGPDGGDLTIDVAVLGPDRPKRALLIMSGTHGIEGFAGSMVQCALLEERPELSEDDGVVLVHGVNPWGMAWWRRANENNVDLNRNWSAAGGVDSLGATASSPGLNEAYADLHDLLCPDDMSALDGETFLAELGRIVEQRGVGWVRHAIAGGQYSHADGLYFGGTEEQTSTRLLREIADRHLRGVEELLILDLHTGHGRFGTYTVLSRAPMGSSDDRWIRSVFDSDRVETTVGNPDATTSVKTGQLAPGIVAMLAPTAGRSVTLEFGTERETRMIAAERAEHWIHRTGRRETGAGRDAVWEHRICSIPDDAEWETNVLAHGALVIRQGLDAMFGPSATG